MCVLIAIFPVSIASFICMLEKKKLHYEKKLAVVAGNDAAMCAHSISYRRAGDMSK